MRRLTAPMRAFRIGDPDGRYPIYSGEGAALTEGRWHEKGKSSCCLAVPVVFAWFGWNR